MGVHPGKTTSLSSRDNGTVAVRVSQPKKGFEHIYGMNSSPDIVCICYIVTVVRAEAHGLIHVESYRRSHEITDALLVKVALDCMAQKPTASRPEILAQHIKEGSRMSVCYPRKSIRIFRAYYQIPGFPGGGENPWAIEFSDTDGEIMRQPGAVSQSDVLFESGSGGVEVA